MSKVEIDRERAIALLRFCAWKSAHEWDNARLAKKLARVDMMAPEDPPDDEDIAVTLIEVTAGIENGDEIVVVGEKEEEQQTPDPDPEQEQTAEETLDSLVDEEKEEDEKEPEVKPAPPKRKNKPSQETESAKAIDKSLKKRGRGRPKGTTVEKTRAYYAGAVLKKHGFDKGITHKMIVEVDHMYGKPNENTSRQALSNAWSAIRGYVGNG